jgi:hypothetical protein
LAVRNCMSAHRSVDECGQTDYVFVTELVDVAREHVQVSGGYDGPVMLVQELVEPPQGENG